MNESLAKLLRRAIPGMPRVQYQRLKRAIAKSADSAKLRGALRKSFEKTIAKNRAKQGAKGSVGHAPAKAKSTQIPSALNRFMKPVTDRAGVVLQ